MSNNPFAKMNTSAGAKTEDNDSLGGSRLLDTGIADMAIKMFYAITARSGAAGVVVIFEDDKKRTLQITEYISSGDEKGNKNFYVDKESGEEKLLPGYVKIDGLCMLANQKELDAQVWEEKLVPIYNFDAKTDVNTKVFVATSMLGCKVKLGVHKVNENKTKKNDATGKYDPINEAREVNVIDKFFHVETGKTMSEYRERKDAAEFLPKWVAKYGTATIDKFKAVVGGATAGAPGQAAAGSSKPTESLF